MFLHMHKIYKCSVSMLPTAHGASISQLWSMLGAHRHIWHILHYKVIDQCLLIFQYYIISKLGSNSPNAHIPHLHKEIKWKNGLFSKIYTKYRPKSIKMDRLGSPEHTKIITFKNQTLSDLRETRYFLRFWCK